MARTKTTRRLSVSISPAARRQRRRSSKSPRRRRSSKKTEAISIVVSPVKQYRKLRSPGGHRKRRASATIPKTGRRTAYNMFVAHYIKMHYVKGSGQLAARKALSDAAMAWRSGKRVVSPRKSPKKRRSSKKTVVTVSVSPRKSPKKRRSRRSPKHWGMAY
jgi:hypothetical protein